MGFDIVSAFHFLLGSKVGLIYIRTQPLDGANLVLLRLFSIIDLDCLRSEMRKRNNWIRCVHLIRHSRKP